MENVYKLLYSVRTDVQTREVTSITLKKLDEAIEGLQVHVAMQASQVQANKKMTAKRIIKYILIVSAVFLLLTTFFG